MKKLFIIVYVFIIGIGNVYSVSINAAFSKNAMEENKLFIDFINPHLTNFITDENFKAYKNAVELDFEASVHYLSGNYKLCFEKIIESQKVLRKIYYELLTKRFEVDTEEILKMSGPIIMLAKDKKAEYYLQSGYNEKGRAMEARKIGFGVNHFMLSKKIKFYIDAINHNVKAKRYAIRALVESTIPIIDKSDYKTQTYQESLKSEYGSDKSDEIEISEYEHLRNELINNVNKKSLPTNYPFLLHHNDNYRVIHNNKKSALNEIGEGINSSVKGMKNIKTESLDNSKSENQNPKEDQTPQTVKPDK